MRLTQPDKDTLEALLDRTSARAVLSALSEICADKAEHVAVNWQDCTLAKLWLNVSSKLAKLELEKLP